LLEFCNNTEKDISIRIGEKTYSVKSGAVADITPYSFADTKIQVSSEDEILEYEVPRLPSEYVPARGMRLGVLHLQMDHDNLVYVLMPDITMPSNALEPQPRGFPLKPSRKKLGKATP